MATEKKEGKPKRRIKNPESFREKAQKAASEKIKPKKRSKVTRVLGKPFVVAARPFVRVNNKLKKIKALKPVYKVLSIVGRIIFPKYIRNSFKELTRVEWPNFKESLRLTYAVLVFAVLFGAAIALLDYGLTKVFKIILLK